jgi:hypothetical protein
MKTAEIIEAIKAIPADDKKYFFLELLNDGVLDYVELSKLYVDNLKGINAERNEIITDLGYSLVMYKDPTMNMGNPHMLTKKVNGALLKTSLFWGTPFEKQLKEELINANKNL